MLVGGFVEFKIKLGLYLRYVDFNRIDRDYVIGFEIFIGGFSSKRGFLSVRFLFFRWLRFCVCGYCEGKVGFIRYRFVE